MALIRAASSHLDIATYNGRFWGKTAWVYDKQTSVYCGDYQRAALLQRRLQAMTQRPVNPLPLPDLVGFTEFWDQGLLPVFQDSGLWTDHQMRHGPFQDGLTKIFPILKERSPVLHDLIKRDPDIMIRRFAQDQLANGAEGVFNPVWLFLSFLETQAHRYVVAPIKESLVGMMEGQVFMGSGLVLFSRHEIVESWFVPFESEKSGLDKYAQKGVLCAIVRLPNGKLVLVLVTHFHIGNQPEEKAARRQEVLQTAGLVRSSPYDVILMGDLNIVAEKRDPASGRLVPTEDYLWTVDQLGLVDVFRHLHPDPNENEESRGFTFDNTLHFSRKLNIESLPGSPDSEQRLDFLFCSRGLIPWTCKVLKQEFKRLKIGGRPLSDHRFLWARIAS